jgi:translation initiation factor IF-1
MVYENEKFNEILIVAKEENFKLKGQITEALPNAQFMIKLETGQEILGHLAGRLRVNRITILPGDSVDVELSPYDISKGRITYRHKG